MRAISLVFVSVGLAAMVSVAAAAVGCSSSSDSGAAPPTTPSGGAGSTGAGGTGTGGSAPTGPCFPTKDSGCATVVDPTCVARTDNSQSMTKTLRLSELRVTAPSALTSMVIQNNIVTSGIDLNDPSCYQFGKGLFNWLLSFDTAGKMVTTGGSQLENSPVGPYCFLNKTIGSTMVAPVTATYTEDSSGIKTDVIPVINIPIYVDNTGTDPIILPISGGQLSNVVLSNGGNCIGKFKGDSMDLDPTDSCKPVGTDPKMDNDYAWVTAGHLEGYITAQQADSVNVALLGETLCAFLSGKSDPNTNPKACVKNADGSLDTNGKTDYASMPGGPMDSFHLAADFAASAVQITGNCGGLPDRTSSLTPRPRARAPGRFVSIMPTCRNGRLRLDLPRAARVASPSWRSGSRGRSLLRCLRSSRVAEGVADAAAVPA